MDTLLASKLAHLLRTTRQASLGTLNNGAPFISMVLFAPSPDFCSFYIHISSLAQHTRDIAADSRVSIMVMEKDNGAVDPQQFSRVSIMGQAFEVSGADSDYMQASFLYRERYPASVPYFTMADFHLFRIRAEAGRFVAGFAKVANLGIEDLLQASKIE